MGWRNIVISNPTKLSIKDRQLVITQEDKIKIPLEDISSIIIEDNQSTITSHTLSQLSNNNIILYTCDERHVPNGVLTSFNSHSRQLSILNLQINLSKPFKKRIWQNIIVSKLENQAMCLQYLNAEGSQKILSISKDVDSGDKSNREAYSAKLYFKYLFGDKFIRSEGNSINSYLNYGYAILRGSIARTLVGYGFNPSIGIHHHSELNNFNLADDFIEPFRPVVDLYVKSKIGCNTDLTREMKIGLYNLLNYDVLIGEEIHSVNNAIDIMIKSFVTCCKLEDYNHIKLPKLLFLKVHCYE